jgi:integrase
MVFFRTAYKKKLHKNNCFDEDWFDIPSEDTVDIFLSIAELKALAKKNLLNKSMDLARDWFIIDCFTGLRISDLVLLDKQNLQKGFITISNEKTNVQVTIPVHPLVQDVIKKYKGFPPKITSQEINREIKKAAELAKINDTFLWQITKGGKRVNEYIPKYQMVSCHTSRRSFITNLLLNQVPDNIVMQLAGIKKHSTLLKYKKATPMQTAELMKDHAFFK